MITPKPFQFFCVLVLGLSLAACAPGPTASVEVAVKGLYSGAYSERGDYFVIGSIHHGGSLWQSPDERLFNWNHHTGEASVIVASDISPEGGFAITAEARALVLWSTQSGEALAYLATPAEILDVALGSNGNYALVGMTDNSALLYSLRQKSVVRVLQHSNSVRSVALSKDGRYGLTGSEDTSAILWDLNTGLLLHTFSHSDDVQQVALSPDGSLALTAAQYDKAVIWRTSDGTALGTLPLSAEGLKRGLRFTAARFSANGDQLLTGSPDQRVQLWDVNRMTELAHWQLPKRNAWKPTSASVIDVAFSQKPGVYLALASNGFAHQLRQTK